MSAATAFPRAVQRLRDDLAIRRGNLAAEEKLLAGHVRSRDECQNNVDRFQESVDNIRADIASMEDEIARLTDV